MATFKEVYLKIFIALIMIQIDIKSERIQFLDVNHHVATKPKPMKKHMMSIALIGIGPILKPYLRIVCLIQL